MDERARISLYEDWDDEDDERLTNDDNVASTSLFVPDGAGLLTTAIDLEVFDTIDIDVTGCLGGGYFAP